MNNKKTLTFIGAALIAVLAMVFTYFYVVQKPAPKQPEQTIKKIDEITPETKITAEEKEVIVKNEEKLLGEFIAAGDAADCGRLSEKYKIICQNNIILNQAKAGLNKSLCDQATGQEFIANCYSQVETEKVKRAQVQAEETVKSNEQRFLTSDEYKEMTSYKEKNQPIPELTMVEYMGMVYDYREPKNCYYLPDSQIQECLNLLYLNLARLDDDLEGCNLIKSDYWKNICVRDIITRRAHKQLNPALCEALDGRDKDECLVGLR